MVDAAQCTKCTKADGWRAKLVEATQEEGGRETIEGVDRRGEDGGGSDGKDDSDGEIDCRQDSVSSDKSSQARALNDVGEKFKKESQEKGD